MTEENNMAELAEGVSLEDMTEEQLIAAYSGDAIPESPQESSDIDGDEVEDIENAQDSDEPVSESDDPESDDVEVDDDEDGIEDADSLGDRTATLAEFIADNEGLRIDTGDGVHTLENVLMRHRDVQIKKQELAEQRKEIEAEREAMGANGELVQHAKAIQQRIESDASGLGLDAIAMLYPQAARKVAEVLSEFGWSPDKAARKLAEAKLHAVENKPEPAQPQGRKDSEVLRLRDSIEGALKHEFTDRQWNAIYTDMEAHESAGDDWQLASQKAVSELYPAIWERFLNGDKPKPKKRKPTSKARPKGRANPQPTNLNDMSDEQLLEAYKRTA
jgi:hypothetical protein